MSKDPINFMFQEQVGMVVFNPTNENFDMQFSGVSFTMKPGEKLSMAANAANHLLNSFSPRGLCYLAYGADEEKIAAAGKQRNDDFKRKQVTDFNISNENRKNMNLGYLPPTEKLKEYALELGLVLMQPYAPRDKERVQINEQSSEISEMRQTIADLTNLVNKLMASKEEPQKEEETRKPGNPNFIKKQ
jgi:hypothetical protein